MSSWWGTEDYLRYERAMEKEGERARVLSNATWGTRVIDLSVSQNELWGGIRKSYRSIIMHTWQNESMVWATPDGEAFAHDCRLLHERASGRVTRPVETWDIQGQWIDAGTAVAIVAIRLGQAVEDKEQKAFILTGSELAAQATDGAVSVQSAVPVGFAFAVIHQTWAYYFSGASAEPNVMHSIQWNMMRLLKERGVLKYEMGWQGEASDDKGKAVEFFKRGFGGADVPARIVGLVQ